LLVSICLFLFGIAFPLEWLSPPQHDQRLAMLGNPLTPSVLFFVCLLSLFHRVHGSAARCSTA
jgi:fumarate reductase subunit D